MAHHQQLLDWIENELINQNLHLGDELPNDRALARAVGISHNLMRESLKHCEEIGVLRLYEGHKKSIIGVLLREPASSAGPAISLYLASSRAPRQDLLNTCLLLESYALAGPSYDESAFPELDRIITAMQDAGTSLSDFHDLEADFHIQLGRLSGNALVSALLATLRDAMIEARFELVNRVPLWSATSARLRMEYRAIVDAARSGDPGLAQTLLRANLQERFAEAGHRINLPEEMGQEAESPQFNMESVDVDANGLIPEEWGGAIEPNLFQALATIQPIKAPAGVSSPLLEEKPEPEVEREENSLSLQQGSAPEEKPAPELAADFEGDVPALDRPERAETITAASPVEKPAVPTGSATRKRRRGTVSPVVRATVIPPRQAVPKPVPVQDLADSQPVIQQEDRGASHPEPALAPADTVAEETLEEKLKQEEARLATAPLESGDKTEPVESEPESNPGTESVSAGLEAGGKDGPAELSDSATPSENKSPLRARSKKLMGIAHYFGFKQPKPSDQPARPVEPSSDVDEDLPVGDEALEVDSAEGTNLLEGYEYIDPFADDEDETDYTDTHGDDFPRSVPWQDDSSESLEAHTEETTQEEEHKSAEATTDEPVGQILGQKKGKKKSKKNRR